MYEQKNRKQIPWACIVPLAVVVGLTACGGGGSSSSSTTTDGTAVSASAGFSLPTEITAVPAASSSSSSPSLMLKAFNSARNIRALSLPATSDYVKEQSFKYVHSESLEVFSIIETIMKALAQTKYTDTSVLNQGAYKAMVSWEEKGERGGNSTKQSQEWVVNSKMLADSSAPNASKTVNLVDVWINEASENRLIKAEFKIFASASVANDGELVDMGQWTMNVRFTSTNGGSSEGFFKASATVDADGFSVLTVHEADTGDNFGGKMPASLDGSMEAVLHRKADIGYGKVSMPNQNALGRCAFDNGLNADQDSDGHLSDTELTQCLTGLSAQARVAMTYAYNAGYLIIDSNGDGTVDVASDRDLTNAAEITHRYGVYYKDAGNNISAGDNVLRHKSFGFPVRADLNSDGSYESFGYYGAFQGQHNLWLGNQAATNGMTVQKEDWSTGQRVLTDYTVATFNTLFGRRSLVEVSLADIKGIGLQSFMSKHWELTYLSAGADGAGWYVCSGWVNTNVNPATCNSFGGQDANGNPIASTTLAMTKFDAFPLLNKADFRFIHYQPIGGGGGNQVNYAPGDDAFNVGGAPSDGDRLFVNAGGQIWLKVVVDNAGAYRWKVLTVNNSSTTWPPEFSGVTAFTFPKGDDMFVNSNGANYVIKLKSGDGTQAADYLVLAELQSVANPQNASTFVPGSVAYFAAPWGDANTKTKYYFNSSDMTLHEGSVGGTEVSQDQWGLFAYDNSDHALTISSTGVASVSAVDSTGNPLLYGTGAAAQFNYRAKQSDGNGGFRAQQTFLKDASNNWQILDNPIALVNVPVYRRGASTPETISQLQFDGWMHGLPDLFSIFKGGNNFDSMLEKVVNIHADTEVVGTDSVNYVIKPLETSVFLKDVTSAYNSNSLTGAPTLTSATAIDLTGAVATLPASADNTMGDIPANPTMLFIDGVPVSSN